MEVLPGGDWEFEVHANVDDHADTARSLGPQHAEVVVRVVEIAQFGHEPLGVQGPSLDVPGCPAHELLKPRQAVTKVAAASAFEVMSRYALVVCDRYLAPQREP